MLLIVLVQSVGVTANTSCVIFLLISGDIACRPVRKLPKRKEIVPVLHDWVKMRETSMHNAEKSLLPLRRKISPPAILNFETHATEHVDDDKEITNTEGKRERLFSASSRGISASKYEPSLSERCLTLPFTPPATSDTKETFTQSFHLRRPSDHFLEVLEEQKGGQPFPKVPSATSLPPLGKPSHGEDLSKRTLGELKIAFTGSVCNSGLSHPSDCDNQLLLSSGTKTAFEAPNHANRKVLRKTNSLPVIKTYYNTLTNGLSDMNNATFQSRTKSAVIRQERTLDESETRAPFDENLEELDDENGVFEEDEEQMDLEKFSMIRHWLKECEKAKIT